uniref:Uncharacterized protein n=1 Tax=Oryza barthii TaxID=65489 RepID=A0A0D3GZZ7_9ORYZ
MSRRVCQTREQLGTNTRNSVANIVPARQGTTMNHTQILERRQWQLGDTAAMLEVDKEDPSG